VIDIAKIATNLEIKESGLWVSRNQSHVFYPETGNAGSFEIEGDSFWFEHRNNCILAAMQMFSPPGTVFDIGGGNGFVALGIKNAGIEVVLVEPGFEGVRNARVRGLTTIICSTLEDAGFLKHTIPAIGIFDVLEHIEDDTAFLNTLRACLCKVDGSTLLYPLMISYGQSRTTLPNITGDTRRKPSARN
jgi:2-polyprenyl-3-methyl-5-hydroxy-6-metoxy-1,4-benzoquinol methylase